MKFPECENCGTRLIPEMMHCPHCGAEAKHDVPTDLRCECGFLLCKLDTDFIEVKCRRCKRLVHLPFAGLPERYGELRSQRRRAGEAREKQGQGEGQSEGKGQYCASCGKHKQYVVYGKCIDCRTESIKVQYKSKGR